jgi:UDP-2-acetamido-2,6-beta-L-arabino-hexul-4-ose reductase
MINIGVTGSNGFLGSHLSQFLALQQEFSIIKFDRIFFNDSKKLDDFVLKCDVIVHLAAINRHMDAKVIYDTNVFLVKTLIESLYRTKKKPHIIFSSSIQEGRDDSYGKSKKDCRLLLSEWAHKKRAIFSGLIIPNVFGPFGRPYHNSVIATFCDEITKGKVPKVHVDNELKLIYVGDLVDKIIELIRTKRNAHELIIPPIAKCKVSEILTLLKSFRIFYQDLGEIPEILNRYEWKLFITYCSYIPIKSYFPKHCIKHSDSRGSFVEIMRQRVQGQTSFSSTLPGITRGNHFHTRKFERFAVIKGKALIQLRRIGSSETHEFFIDGNNPAYVDMPVWYTHNIKNVGEDTLFTIFWINEFFNPNDPDTYFEIV